MAEAKKRSFAKTFFLLFIPGVIVALSAILYTEWYRHAVAGDSPYDSNFIEINLRMPESARTWACDKIAERFPGTLPPHSCAEY